MSAPTVPYSPTKVNRSHRKIDKYRNPEPESIPSLWAELVAHESLAPDALRGGIARVRTRLLASIPNWRVPAILDELTSQEAEPCMTSM